MKGEESEACNYIVCLSFFFSHSSFQMRFYQNNIGNSIASLNLDIVIIK